MPRKPTKPARKPRARRADPPPVLRAHALQLWARYALSDARVLAVQLEADLQASLATRGDDWLSPIRHVAVRLPAVPVVVLAGEALP